MKFGSILSNRRITSFTFQYTGDCGVKRVPLLKHCFCNGNKGVVPQAFLHSGLSQS